MCIRERSSARSVEKKRHANRGLAAVSDPVTRHGGALREAARRRARLGVAGRGPARARRSPASRPVGMGVHDRPRSGLPGAETGVRGQPDVTAGQVAGRTSQRRPSARNHGHGEH